MDAELLTIIDTGYPLAEMLLEQLTGDSNMNLRKQIERHKFLFIDDETSDANGFAVHDRRGGRNFGTWIDSVESLEFLVKHGAEAWLESKFNGIGV